MCKRASQMPQSSMVTTQPAPHPAKPSAPPTSTPPLLPSTNTKTKAITYPQPLHSIDEVHQLLLKIMEDMGNPKSSLHEMTLITPNLPSLLEKPNQNCSRISPIILPHTRTRTTTAPTPSMTRSNDNPHSTFPDCCMARLTYTQQQPLPLPPQHPTKRYPTLSLTHHQSHQLPQTLMLIQHKTPDTLLIPLNDSYTLPHHLTRAANLSKSAQHSSIGARHMTR